MSAYARAYVVCLLAHVYLNVCEAKTLEKLATHFLRKNF